MSVYLSLCLICDDRSPFFIVCKCVCLKVRIMWIITAAIGNGNTTPTSRSACVHVCDEARLTHMWYSCWVLSAQSAAGSDYTRPLGLSRCRLTSIWGAPCRCGPHLWEDKKRTQLFCQTTSFMCDFPPPFFFLIVRQNQVLLLLINLAFPVSFPINQHCIYPNRPVLLTSTKAEDFVSTCWCTLCRELASGSS